MKLNKKHFLLVALALLVVFPLTEAFAGSTGKIMGKVMDGAGAPLPGASVVIEGTQRGAIADPEGHYLIVAVDPGTYDLTASLVGYTNVTQQDAEVKVDYTTTLDFTLKEEAIEAAEIVVTAERPLVEVDKTSTKYILTADDIEAAPIIKTTGELVSLQPGVDQSGTFSVRGSDMSHGTQPLQHGYTWSYRGNDVYVVIDGVRVPQLDGNSAMLFTGVNKSAVQQISVETGVTPAEYGDAQGGTINIVTQDGSKDLHGWTEVNFEPASKKHWGADVHDAPLHRDHMKWDDPNWLKETDPLTGRLVHVREDYTSYSGITLEGSVAGPAGPSASFVASGRHERQACTYPAATNHGFYNDRGEYINAPNNIQGSATGTLKPTGSTKLKAGFIFQRFTAFNDEINERFYTEEGFIRGMRYNGRNLFLPKGWASSGKYRLREDLAYASFTHTISPKTFYEIRIARSRTLQDTIGVPTFTTDPRRDKDGWFFLDRDAAMWIDSHRKRWSLKTDISSQLTKGNFVKAGIEAVRYDSYYTYWAGRSRASNWFTMYTGGDTPWEMGSAATPIRGAAYLQDKMEFEGMIINVGVRLDFNKHGHEEIRFSSLHFAPMWRRYTQMHYAYGVGTGDGVTPSQSFADTPPTQLYVSPRLGVSHPITDRMVMHFSLGRFVQWCDFYESYAKSFRSQGRTGPDGDPNWEDKNGDGVMQQAERFANMAHRSSGRGGDPWVGAEETLTFEVGTDWNFVQDYTASLTVFYRNETQQMCRRGGRWRSTKGAGYMRGVTNNRAGYSKGLELALGKRMSNYVSFRVAWSMQWSAVGAMGLASGGKDAIPDSGFVVSDAFWYDFRTNPDGSETAIALTQEEKETFGARSNRYVRDYTNAYVDNLRIYFGKEVNLKSLGMYVIQNSLGGTSYGPMGARQEEKLHGIVGQANLQFVLNTPSDVGFGGRYLGWASSNLSANLLWKLRTGKYVTWSPPAGGRLVNRGPVTTVTDLSVEKVFNPKGRVRPSFFIEVRNLFNTKVDMGSGAHLDTRASLYQDAGAGSDYMMWGLLTASPDNADWLKYGDVKDQDYYHSPRETNLGVRVTF